MLSFISFFFKIIVDKIFHSVKQLENVVLRFKYVVVSLKLKNNSLA